MTLLDVPDRGDDRPTLRGGDIVVREPEPPAAPETVDPITAAATETAGPTAAAPEATAPPATTPAKTAGPTKRRPQSGARRTRSTDSAPWTTALDDPSITDGHHGYRSFYVDDAVFARFRAAVYWTARRHDATGVPDNMSVGVEAYMDDIATDLERRYNNGNTFRPTPDQLRAHQKRTDTSR